MQLCKIEAPQYFSTSLGATRLIYNLKNNIVYPEEFLKNLTICNEKEQIYGFFLFLIKFNRI